MATIAPHQPLQSVFRTRWSQYPDRCPEQNSRTGAKSGNQPLQPIRSHNLIIYEKNQSPVPTPRFQRDCGQRGFQARLPAHSSAWARSVASHPLREPQLRKRSSFIFNQAPDDTVRRQSHHSPTSDQRHQHLGRCLISVATAIFKRTNRTSIEPPLLPAQRC